MHSWDFTDQILEVRAMDFIKLSWGIKRIVSLGVFSLIQSQRVSLDLFHSSQWHSLWGPQTIPSVFVYAEIPDSYLCMVTWANYTVLHLVQNSRLHCRYSHLNAMYISLLQEEMLLYLQFCLLCDCCTLHWKFMSSLLLASTAPEPSILISVFLPDSES